MTGGNGAGQDSAVNQVNRLMFAQVYPNRPQRMILSRELMPRYSRMSPESANIFDNLHMLHGLAYDAPTRASRARSGRTTGRYGRATRPASYP